MPEVCFTPVSRAAESKSWVGQSLPRLENEALLRSKGRLLDDLDPAHCNSPSPFALRREDVELPAAALRVSELLSSSAS
jgi:hypothetical protein